jgi:hypothetical protein
VNIAQVFLVGWILEDLGNPTRDDFHFAFLHRARSECRRADANTAGDKGRTFLVWNCILVNGDAGFIEGDFRIFAGDFP